MQAYEKTLYRGISGLYLSWGALGFYRGVQEYKYKYDKKEETSLHAVGSGFVGMAQYVFPFFLPISVSSEIYRLGVNLCGREKTPKYYNVFCILHILHS